MDMDYSIIDKHHNSIKYFILMTVKDPWIADDLAQETFFRAHKNRDAIKDPSKLRSWLYRIAYNLCMDHFRSAGSMKSAPLDSVAVPKSLQYTFEKEYERNEMSLCVQEKMQLLSEKYRTVLWLFDVQGFKLKEIADVLDISLENTKVRLHRARQKLKLILRDNCNFERDERDVFVCSPKV